MKKSKNNYFFSEFIRNLVLIVCINGLIIGYILFFLFMQYDNNKATVNYFFNKIQSKQLETLKNSYRLYKNLENEETLYDHPYYKRIKIEKEQQENL